MILLCYLQGIERLQQRFRAYRGQSARQPAFQAHNLCTARRRRRGVVVIGLHYLRRSDDYVIRSLQSSTSDPRCRKVLLYVASNVRLFSSRYFSHGRPGTAPTSGEARQTRQPGCFRQTPEVTLVARYVLSMGIRTGLRKETHAAVVAAAG